jgi:GT2 family glycosyltransferase
MYQPNISLIIPSYKNPECLDLCLKSAIENKLLTETEIVVTIDGYPEVSKHIIEKYNNRVNFLVYDENTGMQNAINSAVYQCKNNYIFIINEDNVLPIEWDYRIKEIICEHKCGFAFTVKQIEREQSIYNFHKADFGSEPNNFKYDEFLKHEIKLSRQYNDIFTNDGGLFPFIMNKNDFMIVGGFDIGYPSPHVVDYDFFYKLELLGVNFKMIQTISLYHFGQMSTKKVTNEVDSFNERERMAYEYYKFKWKEYPILKIHNKY